MKAVTTVGGREDASTGKVEFIFPNAKSMCRMVGVGVPYAKVVVDAEEVVVLAIGAKAWEDVQEELRRFGVREICEFDSYVPLKFRDGDDPSCLESLVKLFYEYHGVTSRKTPSTRESQNSSRHKFSRVRVVMNQIGKCEFYAPSEEHRIDRAAVSELQGAHMVPTVSIRFQSGSRINIGLELSCELGDVAPGLHKYQDSLCMSMECAGGSRSATPIEQLHAPIWNEREDFDVFDGTISEGGHEMKARAYRNTEEAVPGHVVSDWWERRRLLKSHPSMRLPFHFAISHCWKIQDYSQAAPYLFKAQRDLIEKRVVYKRSRSLPKRLLELIKNAFSHAPVEKHIKVQKLEVRFLVNHAMTHLPS